MVYNSLVTDTSLSLSDEELERLIFGPESDRVERKTSATDRSKIRRTICAFANDLAGHNQPEVIAIGLDDTGRSTGLEVTDDLLQTLAQMRTNGAILPQPTLVVERRIVRGCALAVVIVAPSEVPPVRYQGRVWVRVGPTVQEATPEEERHLAERRRATDLPFDMRPAPDATPDDLDLVFFRTEYLPAAIDPDVLERNERPLLRQLESLRFLARNGQPTYGAILVMGRDVLAHVPGAYLQFLRIDGGDLADPIRDQKLLSGPLPHVLRELEELLEINITVASDAASGALEHRHPDYPIIALRQLARNALMHRAYEGTNAPVRLYWFANRIEIHNPGGLYGQVNANNFGQGVTDYRNPLIAEAMRVLGYVQRFGMGVPLARRELEENGNPPPEFDFQPGATLVTVRSCG